MIAVKLHICSLLLVATLAGCPGGRAAALRSCPAAPRDPLATGEDRDVATLARGNRQFAFDLFRKLAAKNGGRENVVLSPYGISRALAVAAAGARGETRAEMARTLHIGLPPARTHVAFRRLITEVEPSEQGLPSRLEVATALFGQDGYRYRAAFVDQAKHAYRTDFRTVDFRSATQARQTINRWLADKTHGRFKALLPRRAIDKNSQLLLATAISLRAKWQLPFVPEGTRGEPFHLPDGRTRRVPTMVMEATVPYADRGEVQLIELAYKGGQLSMVIVLPRSAAQRRALEGHLGAAWFRCQTAALARREVQILLPKFAFTTRYDLGPDLARLGMALPMSEAADFSAIGGGQRPLKIDRVVHTAFVKVDEAGTEAAAATTTVLGIPIGAPPKPPPVFRADRPFFFFIRDQRTNTVVFMGRVADPR